MDVLIVVHAVDSVWMEPETVGLAAGLEGRRCGVWFAGLAGLGMERTPFAHVVPAGRDGLPCGVPSRFDMDAFDRVVVRARPRAEPDARRAHAVALELLAVARSQGVVVWNDPEGLRRAGGALYTLAGPAGVRPRALVSADCAALRAFVGAVGHALLTPLAGPGGGRRVSRPQDVLPAVEEMAGRGPVLARAVGPEGASQRLLLVDGALRAVDGVPVGGPAPDGPTVSPDARTVAAAVGPQLRGDGLVFAEIEVSAGKLLGVDPFATGGAGCLSPVLDRIEAGSAA